MELNLPIIFWTRKFWKIRAFDYNEHIVSIMYTNSTFPSIGKTSDFGTKFNPKKYEEKRIFKK